ncbi:hypothetical protein A1O7_05543 [Cladophialophora yegresii CBS 114405]|uniref:Uncharacterized protein n=1 Tax=Cladophialophora yegresii CBS 114405 TaxID=1182544 RepID=W9WHZ1_9EURO|nr:uncharacterized protein A1O7_05543 [Cladophialophora yegresii CBS 114405]EXJ58119.1 hypothetical protein A1O7_05543 [Cladophialophora yegresii CBS 114405]
MSLLHDDTQHGTFEDLLEDSRAPFMDTNELKMEILDIIQTGTGQLMPLRGYTTASELARGSRPNLRLIFAPLDYPTPASGKTLTALFQMFSVPTAFISERVQSVTHAFSFEGSKDGEFRTWLHFLCKAIEDKLDNILWLRSGYFLSRDSQSRTTLICFGASSLLEKRFNSLPSENWKDALDDPFRLFTVVLSDLHFQLDEQLWSLNTSVGAVEQHTIASNDVREFKHNFVHLHYIAKNLIHLKEASDAILRTVQHMIEEQTDNTSPRSVGCRKTLSALRYQQTLFESINLRAVSMEKRMQNVINLSFNLVAQKDSSTILTESSSMHTIALTTLIFLPISTVATIFGSQFFMFIDSGDRDAFHVSPQFWIFWAITVPLTIVVLTTWIYFHPSNVSRWPLLKRSNKRDQACRILDLPGK